MESKNGAENKILQTYADDMAEVLENDTEGLIKKIIQEEEGHEAEKKNLSPESKKNKIFMLVGAIFVLFSVALLFFFVLNKNKSTVSVEKQFTPIIFNEETSLLEIAGLKKETIVQNILKEINDAEIKVGGIKGIYLSENKQLLGLRRFLSVLGSSFVPDENAIFFDDNFLIGVVNVQSGEAKTSGEGFFLLIKVRSMIDVFDALRSWEGKMLYDLHRLAGIPFSGDTNYLFNKNFEDGIIENKNARILYNKDKEIAFAYVFTSDTSVTFTNSAQAVREIVLRLNSASRKQ